MCVPSVPDGVTWALVWKVRTYEESIRQTINKCKVITYIYIQYTNNLRLIIYK